MRYTYVIVKTDGEVITMDANDILDVIMRCGINSEYIHSVLRTPSHQQ